MIPRVWLWVGFNALVLLLLALDLFVFHRKAHEIRTREAAGWTAFWIALALVFNAGIYWFMGPAKGLEFLTGYLIEKALSVDNIFVFVMVFAYFGVPAKYQHRVLFWGILGALLMRGAMIGAGVFLINRFEWVMYIFGAFLVVTAVRMAIHDERDIEPEANPIIRLVRRLIPITSTYHGQKFFVRENARFMATPLFVVLVFVEVTDLVFAVDSIPAIFAITRDPFIVYTSNVFAILGLRALYFLLASVIHRFHYLQLGLSVVLGFVGMKMLVEDFLHIPVGISLGVVALVLASAVGASLLWPKDSEAVSPVRSPPLDHSDPPEDDAA